MSTEQPTAEQPEKSMLPRRIAEAVNDLIRANIRFENAQSHSERIEANFDVNGGIDNLTKVIELLLSPPKPAPNPDLKRL